MGFIAGLGRLAALVPLVAAKAAVEPDQIASFDPSWYKKIPIPESAPRLLQSCAWRTTIGIHVVARIHSPCAAKVIQTGFASCIR